MVTKDRPQYNGDDAADAALKADAADHGRGDALEHQAAAEIGLARTGPRRQHQRAERRQQAARDVGQEQIASARQAREVRRARVVADQIERAAEHRAIEQQIEQQATTIASVTGIGIPGMNVPS